MSPAEQSTAPVHKSFRLTPDRPGGTGWRVARAALILYFCTLLLSSISLCECTLGIGAVLLACCVVAIASGTVKQRIFAWALFLATAAMLVVSVYR